MYVVQQKMDLSFEKISLPQLASATAVLVLFLIYKDLSVKINLYSGKVTLGGPPEDTLKNRCIKY